MLTRQLARAPVSVFVVRTACVGPDEVSHEASRSGKGNVWNTHAAFQVALNFARSFTLKYGDTLTVLSSKVLRVDRFDWQRPIF